MSDRKPDDPVPPPTRIWSGDGTPPAEKAPVQLGWLNRPAPSTGRHAAITNTLYSWNSYKSWADRVKNSWDKDK